MQRPSCWSNNGCEEESVKEEEIERERERERDL